MTSPSLEGEEMFQERPNRPKINFVRLGSSYCKVKIIICAHL